MVARLVTRAMSVTVAYKGRCAIITMDSGENRFTTTFVNEFEKILDEILESDAAIVVTVGNSKCFSNGLDLDWVMEQPFQAVTDYVHQVMKLLSRILTFPLPTIAAISGHAFAGGAMLALAHDCRLMNESKGWFCLPEVRLGLSLTPGMISLVRAKVKTPAVLTDLILFGKRYNSTEALASGIIDGKCNLSEIVDRSCEYLLQRTGINKSDLVAKTFQGMKLDLYKDVAEAVVILPDFMQSKI